jgi:hypothetical protein
MIYHRTLSPKADPTVRGTGYRLDLEIKFRRRSAAQRELGLAGHSALLHGRKVEEDQRHMGLDDLDRLDRGPIRGRLAQENDDIALIVGHCQTGTVASLLIQIAGKSGDK